MKISIRFIVALILIISAVAAFVGPVSGAPVAPAIPSVCDCRWTGGGSFFIGDMRVTHGFELYCNTGIAPDNLEVNWNGNRFHLTALTEATCGLDDLGGPTPPMAPCNWIIGQGFGNYNGVAGAWIEFKLTDRGEPGTSDTVSMEIWDSPGGTVVLGPVTDAPLTFGNQQAHRLTGNK